MTTDFELLLLNRLGKIERQQDVLINTPIRAKSVRKARGVYDERGRFKECGEPTNTGRVHPQCMGRAALGPGHCTCHWFYIPKGFGQVVDE